MKLKKRSVIIISVVLAIIILSTVIFILNRKNYIDNRHKVSACISTQFPNQYIENSRGKIIVEIPEVYELLNIVVALSNIDEENSSLINKNSEYYQEVLEHFEEYKNHPIVETIKTANNEMGYSKARNLFVYEFNGDSINHGGVYSSQHIQEKYGIYTEQLEDFAKISGFRQFYEDHKDYYLELITLFEDTVPVKQIWSWLEMNFPIQHDTYKVIMSPLTGGSHNTFNYRDNDNNYSEITMFIATPNIYNSAQNFSEKVVEGLLSLMLFTEIDHNYVNPTTNLDENIMDVVKAFEDIEKWNKASNYGRPALTFNEYMTWGVFLLYANDIYEGDDLKDIEKITVDIMNYRGFVHFQQFYDELLDMYVNKKDDKIVADLYPDILKWCKKYK